MSLYDRRSSQRGKFLSSEEVEGYQKVRNFREPLKDCEWRKYREIDVSVRLLHQSSIWRFILRNVLIKMFLNAKKKHF